MNIAVASIGVATAQGSSADILSGQPLYSPREWPWPPKSWTTSRLCYPANGISPDLKGNDRWRALASEALRECLASRDPNAKLPPLFVGSCNGSAHNLDEETWAQAFDTRILLEGTPWSKRHLPVFSASCASGGHALYAARQVLTNGLASEVVVLAVDILSPSNRENFEGLRILSEKPTDPWQSTSTGFILGEAAVALRLILVSDDRGTTFLHGPVLAGESRDNEGLLRVLRELETKGTQFIFGQGTGPVQIDAAELSALSEFVPKEVPIATTLSHFGHTLGASGLLSIALAALIQEKATPSTLQYFTAAKTLDGRPLLTESSAASEILVTCRALSGACTASFIGRTPRRLQSKPECWRVPVEPGPLSHQLLRSLASEALRHRPEKAPDVLILRMERPLMPPQQALIGERLLPSAVLEVTPGFASQLVARCWGYAGPALCLVGDIDADDCGFKEACQLSGLTVFQINLLGSGDSCAIEWNA